MLYRNICTVCHAADPAQPGVLGPAIAGASRELLEAKLLRGEYPPGHTPARDTQQMPKFSYLEPQIAVIAAYLAVEEGR
jgi:mono/diheme cytochrome c family protein